MRSTFALTSLSALAVSVLAHPPNYPHGGPGSYNPPYAQQKWNLANFTSFVVFGDSYTDDSRLAYFANNSGAAPPVGWVDPVSYDASTGGRIWPEYVKQYTGVNLYNYAVSGAVCSNAITPRLYSTINAPFPAVAQYEIPAYLADSAYTYPNGTKFMTDPPDATVYAIWIGTNDLGVEAFIQDAQRPGTNLTSYVDCVYDQLARVYANGGRFFVLMNLAPLNLAPMYAEPPFTAEPCKYWPDDTAGKNNYTEISGRMMEQVVSVNAVYEYRTPFAVEIERRYPGASFAVYNVHDLMTDIYDNPSEYLNGTAPLNVTGFINHCNLTGGDCVANTSPDSFLWFDELHPSEQTDRVIAKNFVDVVKGASQWATYWSS